MKRINIALLIGGFLMIITLASCKKYLDAPSDKKLVVINTLRDLQSLLDDHYKINYRDPYIGEESADDYFLTQNVWERQDEYSRNRYVWHEKQVVPPYALNQGNNWSEGYDRIYIANVVLENVDLANADNPDKSEHENIKGQALFLRGKTLLQLAWIWCLAFDSASAQTDLGLPLRMTSDFNVKVNRSSLQSTYGQIIKDLTLATTMLPDIPKHPMRASKAAAFGYLARTYLSIRDYKNALLYADSCLRIKSELLDYNDILPTTPFPTGIGRFNEEVIYESKISISNMLYSGRITDEVYDMYDTDDLRKNIFFRKTASTNLTIFMGSYEQDYDLFSGIATDEMYLIRAECNARQGIISEAMEDLNLLLKRRWAKGTFLPLSASRRDEALNMILQERRKELLMRGLRWIDIKRLNKEGFAINLFRKIENEEIVLFPNDPRYALAIPEDVITLSGILQNPR